MYSKHCFILNLVSQQVQMEYMLPNIVLGKLVHCIMCSSFMYLPGSFLHPGPSPTNWTKFTIQHLPSVMVLQSVTHPQLAIFVSSLMPISPFPIRFLHLLARASTTSGISDAYALSLTSVYSPHHWHITRTFKARLLQLTVLCSSKKPSSLVSSISRILLLVPLLQLPGLLILTRSSNLSTGLRYSSASNTKLFLPLIRFYSLPVHITFAISLPSSLHDPLGRRHWSLSFTH